MAKLIDKAIPTDEEAIKYINKELDTSGVDITAIVARKLFEKGYIKDKRNFICSTEGCKAKITCRSLPAISKNSPAFVNQSYSENEHIKECQYNPDSRDKLEPTKKKNSTQFSYSKTGDTVSDLSVKKGFLGEDSPNKIAGKVESTPEEKADTHAVSRTDKNDNKNRSSKKVNQHLKTLQDHVEVYKVDPEFLIITKKGKRQIPIKFLFRSIKRNIFFDEFTASHYTYIYYGNAKLSQPENRNVIRVMFKKPIEVEGNSKKFWPALIILKEFFEIEYPDVLEAFEQGNDISFEAFITLPFFLNGEYLNFSSFNKDMLIEPFSDELYNNFYIRTKA
ncbi:hypothetical protein CI088_07950 [Enterococcus plantarum]|uniref:Uncharacterized protein n=1 Tax=Enterococcus plantarum TaxID=1077675 RepID=A0A2W3Z0Y0_9ENTE|nr:hypothetical protein [Enterococcus plantarum]PZL73778.1 hypothetical protein CI088_07950 [Enterococcus plantarum]